MGRKVNRRRKPEPGPENVSAGKQIGPSVIKPPVGYFPALIEKGGPPVFEAQCIPTDMKLLDVSRYKAFLGERRQIVARRINKFLGTEV